MEGQDKIIANIHRMLQERNIHGVQINTLSENFIIDDSQVKLYYFNCNLSIKQARQVHEDPKIHSSLIIYNGTATCQAKTLLHNIRTSVLPLDFFYYVPIDYMYGIKYRVISASEKQQLKLKIQLKHLPKMLDTDTISMYFGTVSGDVFEIQRKNGIYYRYVVGCQLI